jgi:hypothetical protein
MPATRHDASQSRLIWPPMPGYFALQLVRRGWRVPACIAHEDARWYAIIDGIARDSHIDPAYAPDVARVWTGGLRIPRADYEWLLALKEHALVHDPDHPCLSPHKAIRPNLLRPIIPAVAVR